MLISILINSVQYQVNLSDAIDISIPLISESLGPKCYYAPSFKIEPVVDGNFIGSVEKGSPVNFKNIFVNPHGNGTHTECVGHIVQEPYTINNCLKEFHFLATLVTVVPDLLPNGDQIISEALLRQKLTEMAQTDVVIIRTLPNEINKKTKDYSGSNPPYFKSDAISYLNDRGIKHLITDLPSIDREKDDGKLEGHKTFWGYPDLIDSTKTITELVFIDNYIEDGFFLCNIQITSMETDASPSKIVLFRLY